MRLSALSAFLLPFSLLLATFAQARSHSASSQQIQVYLHPSPSSPHASAPTLSADQAKAVLNHHLGAHASDFDEMPADEGMWGHLMGIWGGRKEVDGARIVIVDGGVSPQGECSTSLDWGDFLSADMVLISQLFCPQICNTNRRSISKTTMTLLPCLRLISSAHSHSSARYSPRCPTTSRTLSMAWR